MAAKFTDIRATMAKAAQEIYRFRRQYSAALFSILLAGVYGIFGLVLSIYALKKLRDTKAYMASGQLLLPGMRLLALGGFFFSLVFTILTVICLVKGAYISPW